MPKSPAPFPYSHPAWSQFNEIVEKVGLWWGEPGLNAEIIADWKGSKL